MPTADFLLRDARSRLAASGADTPALDARLLFLAASGLSHEALIADPHFHIAETVATAFEQLMARRLAGEPVSRILGQREFYGRNFTITPDVLDPRPDTECLIELCLETFPKGAQRILDLGTGSGIIPLTLLLEWRQAIATAVDLSDAALAVAKGNAKALGVDDRCSFVSGSWFEHVEGTFDLIVSNPPYIETTAISALAREVREHDPRMALDGGDSGVEPYGEIASGAVSRLTPGGRVAVEIGAGQAEQVLAIFAVHGFRCIRQARDLGGHVRALLFAVESTPGVVPSGQQHDPSDD